MSNDLNWQEEKTKHGSPVAVLHDGKQRDIVKVYLSPDGNVIRIVLSELVSLAQVTVNAPAKIVDFKRKI
jgi:hypothetical protein